MTYLEYLLKIEIDKQFQKYDLKIKFIDFENYLMRFYDFIFKRIEQKKYKIFISKEIKNKLKNNELHDFYVSCFNDIKCKFENGGDLNPYLNKRSRKGLDDKFKDSLLMDWRIYHLHLSNKKSGKYYFDRSDYLLFVIIEKSQVYFIDVRNHNESRGNNLFEKFDFITIIQNHWPKLIKKYKTKVKSVAYDVSENDLRKLRKNNINTLVKFGDDVISSIGGGVTSNGIPIDVVMNTQRIQRNLNEILDIWYDLDYPSLEIKYIFDTFVLRNKKNLMIIELIG